MKNQSSTSRILAIAVMAFAITPVMAQAVKPAPKTEMPAISGNAQLPAGQQNQTGGPMGETGTMLQSGTPAAPAPVRAAPAPAPISVVPAAAPVAARAPMAARAPAHAPVRRARADRG